MPYRLRLYSGSQLLVATDHESAVEAGRQAAEFPLDDLIESHLDGSSSASVRREVVYIEASGDQRPATHDEEELFEAMAERLAQAGEEEMPACPRCGRKASDHDEPLYPVRPSLQGPVYLACWTAEERGTLPPGFDPED